MQCKTEERVRYLTNDPVVADGVPSVPLQSLPLLDTLIPPEAAGVHITLPFNAAVLKVPMSTLGGISTGRHSGDTSMLKSASPSVRMLIVEIRLPLLFFLS